MRWFHALVSTSFVLVACASTNGETAGGAGAGADVSRDAGAAGDRPSSTPPSPDASDGSMRDAHTDCVPEQDVSSDPDNCGACGKSCGGATCTNYFCDPLLVLDAQERPAGQTHRYLSWSVSQGRVYTWEHAVTQDRYLVLGTSTTPASPASHGQIIQDVPLAQTIDSVAFDDTYVFEAVHGAGEAGQVARKKLDGSEGQGAATKLFSLPADLVWEEIAVQSDAIYLVGAMATGSADDTASIYRIALPIADSAALPAAIVSGRNNAISDLTVVGTHLFWNERFANADWRLVTAETTGGTALEIDPDVGASTGSIASDGTYVYWTTIAPAGELKRCPLANLDPANAEHVTFVSNAQEGLSMRGQFLYVMEQDHHAPYRIDRADGSKARLGSMIVGMPSELGIGVAGVDADYLYVVSQDAKIWRFPSVP